MDTALGDMPIIDMDTHYNEPADLWTSRAPAKLKERRAAHRTAARRKPCLGGGGRDCLVTSRDLPDPRGRQSPAATEVGARLRMMDALGVAIQVVFPNVLGLAGAGTMRVKDPELRNFLRQRVQRRDRGDAGE